MNLFRVEIFCPAPCVATFTDAGTVDAVTALETNKDGGSAAAVRTRDLLAAPARAGHIRAVANKIDCETSAAGSLSFKRIKQSDLGREGALGGLLAFTEVKSVLNGF